MDSARATARVEHALAGAQLGKVDERLAERREERNCNAVVGRRSAIKEADGVARVHAARPYRRARNARRLLERELFTG